MSCLGTLEKMNKIMVAGMRKDIEMASHFVNSDPSKIHDQIVIKIIDNAGRILWAVCEVFDIETINTGTAMRLSACPHIQVKFQMKDCLFLSASMCPFF